MVLADLDLALQAGEMCYLVGASGSGKSTVLRLIAGFLAPDRGRILIGDADVTDLAPERRGVGMVFQHYALWPHLDVAAHVAFGLEVQRVTGREQARRIAEALAMVQLTGLEHRRIGELSGGQQQRVALARALVVRPRVLLLDEPLAHLDPQLRLSMRRDIRAVCRAAGVTALAVTHDLQEALCTGDRLAVLAGGRVAQIGPPRQVYEQPASRLVAAQLGESNCFPAQRTPLGVRCLWGELPLPAAPRPGLDTAGAGAALLVLVRPEAIHLDDPGDAPAAPGATSPPLMAAPGPPAEGAWLRLPGIIEEERYLGMHAQWVVRCAGAVVLVSEQHPPRRALGSAVCCRVALADCHVLPA